VWARSRLQLLYCTGAGQVQATGTVLYWGRPGPGYSYLTVLGQARSRLQVLYCAVLYWGRPGLGYRYCTVLGQARSRLQVLYCTGSGQIQATSTILYGGRPGPGYRYCTVLVWARQGKVLGNVLYQFRSRSRLQVRHSS
jgi:hypothetical protein